jgi:hypothetical protein
MFLFIGCRKRELHYPQKTATRDEITDVSRAVEGFYYKFARFLIIRFMKL